MQIFAFYENKQGTLGLFTLQIGHVMSNWQAQKRAGTKKLKHVGV